VLHDGLLAVPPIPVGKYISRDGFHIDTIWTTAFAGLVVVGAGFAMRRRATSGVPGKLQVFWEVVVSAVSNQVDESLGPKYRRVVPLGVTIFTLVLVANWVEVLPGLYHNSNYAPSPTADVNLCYALGVLVFVLTNVAGIRAKGVKAYFAHFVRKPRAMFPLHVLEELVKPITLALRLFGNLFASAIMIALLLAFPIYFFPASIVLSAVWKLFDMFIGLIQAFIFALLTILYYQFATETDGH
jgi:F-type H+-transporting ATPase subunit a